MTFADVASIVGAFVAGSATAAVLASRLAIAPARAAREKLEAALRDASGEINRLASASSSAEAMLAAKSANEAELRQAYNALKHLPAEISQLTERLRASERHEKDVEARLQSVAQSYVEKAQGALVTAVANRFEGDAKLLREKIDGTIAPLGKRLVDLDTALTGITNTQIADRERMAALLGAFGEKMKSIDDATQRVERVLGSSQARGSWGEFELLRLLELTGMTEHVSFDVQEGGYGPQGGRPDVVLKIPGDYTIPIDAKVPFAAFQSAMTSVAGPDRERLLRDATKAVREHIKALEARRYHAAPGCVGWTIMFVPIEAMLSSLFSHDHELFDVAREARILIASPLALLLYLEAFSRGWSLQRQSENAERILDEAKTLVARLGVFNERMTNVGKHLNKATESYNDAIKSYESRIGPQARKIAELRADAAVPEPMLELDAHARTLDESRIPRLPQAEPAAPSS